MLKVFARRYNRILRWSAIGVSLLAISILAEALPLDVVFVRARAWIDAWGIWGPIAFFILYIVAAALLLPVWPFALLAASLYGVRYGTLALFISGSSAAGVQFLIARYAARRRIALLLERYPLLHALDEAISTGGWRVVVLLRLSPLIPFGLQNYFYGLTALRFWPYLLASALAMLPVEFVYVYAAYVGGAGLEEFYVQHNQLSWQFWLWQAIGLSATIGATAYVALLARRAIRRRLAETQAAQHVEQQENEEEELKWPAGTLLVALLALLLLGSSIWAHACKEDLRLLLDDARRITTKDTKGTKG